MRGRQPAIQAQSGFCMPSQNMLSVKLREELGYGVSQVGVGWSVIGLASIYAGAALFGVAFNAIFGLVPTLISLNFVAGEAIRVFAYATVLLGIGSMLGNALGGLLRDWTQSFTAIYAVALVLCLLLLGLTISLPKVAKRRD